VIWPLATIAIVLARCGRSFTLLHRARAVCIRVGVRSRDGETDIPLSIRFDGPSGISHLASGIWRGGKKVVDWRRGVPR
jgi:hypothetical protein